MQYQLSYLYSLKFGCDFLHVSTVYTLKINSSTSLTFEQEEDERGTVCSRCKSVTFTNEAFG